MTYSESSHETMRAFLENMVGSGFLAKSLGMEVTPAQVVDTTLPQLVKIAEETLPLARVMDNSDLVLHAEGPGAEHNLPWLTALNWLTSTANKNLRGLMRSTLDLLGVDGRRIAREADLRLSGLAPGSLWIGLKLVMPESPLLPADYGLNEQLSRATARLPMLARFIDEESVSPGIREAEPDPAIRDASLVTLLHFSPTGRRGIHTLGISSRAHGSADLSQRERVVLNETLSRPKVDRLKEGSIEGEVREADLDKTRFHLRTPHGVVRCVLPALHVEQAKMMLGSPFRVVGRYESGKDGQPRLMYVERIEELPRTNRLI